ncbi:hypothetical protein B0H34DRAFT_861244 [Crassisporium funariophilum]|nr:hypothetical protein B0H34DRAFT_861244 [Crassisporium funariophilum]
MRSVHVCHSLPVIRNSRSLYLSEVNAQFHATCRFSDNVLRNLWVLILEAYLPASTNKARRWILKIVTRTMDFKIAINRPVLTVKAQRRCGTRISAGPSQHGIIGLRPSKPLSNWRDVLERQYGDQLQQIVWWYNMRSPILIFNVVVFFVMFFPIVWLVILSATIHSSCKTSRYPYISMVVSDVFLLICLTKFTKVILISSTLLGIATMSARPVASFVTELSVSVEGRMMRLEDRLAKWITATQTTMQAHTDFLPTWVHDAGCHQLQDDNQPEKRLDGTPSSTSTLASPSNECTSKPPSSNSHPISVIQIRQPPSETAFDVESWLLV